MATTLDLVHTSLRALRPYTKAGDFSPNETLLTIKNMLQTVNDPFRSNISHGINRLITDAERRVRRSAREIPAPVHDKAMLALYEEAYDPPLDMESLKRMPSHSLGNCYYRFIAANEFDPLETLAHIQATDLLSYTYRRAYKLHDIMHVVMGWDASTLGELRLVAFSVGQSRDDYTRQMPLMALAVLYLHIALKKPWQLPEAVRLDRKYRREGVNAPNLASFRFEEHWEKSPEEVRALYLES